MFTQDATHNGAVASILLLCFLADATCKVVVDANVDPVGQLRSLGHRRTLYHKDRMEVKRRTETGVTVLRETRSVYDHEPLPPPMPTTVDTLPLWYEPRQFESSSKNTIDVYAAAALTSKRVVLASRPSKSSV